MFKKTYQVSGKYLYVYCELMEYNDDIENWMQMFDLIQCDDCNYYIKIYNNKTIYSINGVENEIEGKILHTDLYPLFYNMIANIINDNHNMLLHSAVLCYNNIGILVVGDFGSGKTSLCVESTKHNIKILTTDQSHLKNQNGVLKLINGSKYMRIRNGKSIFIEKNSNEVEIKIIINLIGLCDCGNLKFELIEKSEHKIKTLFKYFTWHSDIPLFSNNILLNIDRTKIKKWLTNIDIPLYNVRGDINEILDKIKENIK